MISVAHLLRHPPGIGSGWIPSLPTVRNALYSPKQKNQKANFALVPLPRPLKKTLEGLVQQIASAVIACPLTQKKDVVIGEFQ